MSMSKSALIVLVVACVAAFICQGCELFSKLPTTGPAETAEPTGEGTGERHETGTPAETTEPAEVAWVKVTSPADHATGVDTKLPVKWWVDPAAGEVTIEMTLTKEAGGWMITGMDIEGM